MQKTLLAIIAAASERDGAFGQVKLWIELDNTRVPVSVDDTATDTDGSSDTSEVVFCNRAYQRTVGRSTSAPRTTSPTTATILST